MTEIYEAAVIKNPSWWSRTSALQRGLTLMAVFGVLLIIGLSISIGVVVVTDSGSCNENHSKEAVDSFGEQHNKSSIINKERGNVCLTPSCIHTGLFMWKITSMVLENMDSTVEPCDDFYQFACGRFLETTVIPEDKDVINSFTVIKDKVAVQLRHSIEQASKPNEPKPFLLVKKFYKACMNESGIKEKGLEHILKILKQFGGWPVLEGNSWNESNFNWMESVFQFRNVGFPINYFLSFGITKDLKNSTQHVLGLDEASLENPWYLTEGCENKIVQAYYSYMVDIAVIFGAKREQAEVELKKSLLFEIQLANISLPYRDIRNQTFFYNPMTVAELCKHYPSIPWKSFFNRLLPQSIRVDEDEKVVVTLPEVISDVEKLMATTSKRIQANYVMWRAVADSASYLTEEIRERQLIYDTAKSGRTKRPPRFEDCFDTIISNSYLAISIGAMYVRKNFNNDSNKFANEMVKGIREQFDRMLHTIDWMDEVTKKNALEKATAMTSHIAYPIELLDDSILGKFFEGLELSETDYFQNKLNMTLFEMEFEFRQLRKTVEKGDWLKHGSSSVVNAYYWTTENSIDFPAGILQFPFFNNDRPRYINYGAMGSIIGHEITHGFDNGGSQYDKEGNLVDWWAPSTKDEFLRKVKCIVEQYGNYTVEDIGVKMDGSNTQGENIADNGGIKGAYLAYEDWSTKNGLEPELPGLSFNPQQMFWISNANIWCTKNRPENQEHWITVDSHSPAEFRIIGSFSNMPEFAKDFGCPEGSKMNPKKRCAVW